MPTVLKTDRSQNGACGTVMAAMYGGGSTITGGQTEVVLVEHGNFGPPPYFLILPDALYQGRDGATIFLTHLA